MTAPPAGRRLGPGGRGRALSTPDEIACAIDVYSRAFVGRPAAGTPVSTGCWLGLAAEGRRLAILSNWPLAATHRSLCGGAWLDARSQRDRGEPAGRRDQAPPGDLRGGAGGAR